ncbi:unnamed protein product [Nezara viridula]|uniref:Peptidase S1 domain-containing protein n=1 Tax=Nezara viridula TaxID=85310 RepID=A0A9P0HFQ7_NEZVI|nr:unnamed protein product [Nezara viridula]
MKVLVCLMVICVSWVTSQFTCNCGWRNMKRVVGGKPTNENEYPWMVIINTGCGGSIITEYHVLTAAHCTDGEEASSMMVISGLHYRVRGKNQFMRRHQVSEIIQHPRYDREAGYINDISVLLLSDKIIFNQRVGPVCMPYTKFTLVGKDIKITGWGATKGTGTQNELREVDVEVVDIKECQARWEEYNLKPTSYQICAYTEGKDSCSGDSGGSLVYEDPDTKRFVQVALVSFGPRGCGSDPQPSVNTNVYAYIYWIESAVKRSESRAHLCKKESPSQATKIQEQKEIPIEKSPTTKRPTTKSPRTKRPTTRMPMKYIPESHIQSPDFSEYPIIQAIYDIVNSLTPLG